MPYIACDDGVSLHYRFDGPETAPVLVMSNSLGTDLGMWEPQMPALTGAFRVLRYDTRGHGLSGLSPAPYGVDRLGRDVLALMDELKIGQAAFCGLSMGGMTGMWLGVHAPSRFSHLVLCNTAARIGTPEVWNTRIATVRQGGMGAIVQGVIQRWFTEGFVPAEPQAVEKISAMLLATALEGYCGACEAVRDMDQRQDIAAIRNPVLVIAGTHDLATPAADGHLVADAIPGARYVELPAAHLSNIECRDAFTAALTGFLGA
ncbi:3-oxoadipate enol-lactonase [Ferrovibrio xuzhouensis]|uniref:3-oxoadipate enol-lactonase n=1 Tax=Ferrovibrio xuzhouensis TaxID=1576914 RepID=A0ABV7VIF3_9PROT